MFSFPAWSEGENSEQDVEEVQEKKYVTDKLRLSLYKKADSGSGTLKLLISGDVLDVLDREGPYSKVVTDGGITGWVKNGFLVSIPTASYLLIEEQKKNLNLSEQLEKFSNTQKIVDDYEDTIQKMNTDSEMARQEADEIKQELEKVTTKNNELEGEVDAYTQNSKHLSWKVIINILIQYWYVIVIFILILFLTGIIIGKEIVQAQLRRRFLGVKIL